MTRTQPQLQFLKLFLKILKKESAKNIKGNNNWVDADVLELERLVQIGSAREVDEDIAKEFKLDFDKNLKQI